MRFITLVTALLFVTSPAIAGGLLGDIVNEVAPGAGDTLDDIHDDVKDAIPPYAAAEEAGSEVVQHVTKEIGGEVGGPVLAEWIRASRQDVLNAGTSPIPPQIYQGLQGYFPEEILRSVSYRSGWGNEVALPALSYRFGDADAITLDEVVMFRDENEAQYNLVLWAHELTHVQQYRSWGIDTFAKRYVKDSSGVEADADNNASRFATWYDTNVYNKQQVFQEYFPEYQAQPGPGQSSPFGSYPQTTGLPQSSNICSTPYGQCMLPGYGPIGVSCWCGTPQGPIVGAVLP